MHSVRGGCVPLSDGALIPRLGLGTFRIDDDAAADLVERAVRIGYRHVDTAAMYRNERGIGAGLRRATVAREELFVVTKVWNDQHAYDDTIASCRASLDRLGLAYVDLLLIHWPATQFGGYLDTWRALCALRADGLVRSVGVSNFQQHHIERIAQHSTVPPVVNQVELHPYMPLDELREFHAVNGIRTIAWSPLAKGGALLEEPVVADLARARGCTPAQVVLAWHLALGTVVVPKSSSTARLAENLDAHAVELDVEDLARLRTIRKNHW